MDCLNSDDGSRHARSLCIDSNRRLPVVALVAVVAMALSACGGISRHDAPARVEDRGAQRPPQQGSETQIAAYTPPAQPRIARPQPKRAVSVLMRRADDQRRTGDLDGATVSLERALRIAPDDAMLWHRLAEVRLMQKRHAMVVQLAAKSNALAVSGDRDLRSRNWRLIAQARRGMGDLRGAREADRRVAELR